MRDRDRRSKIEAHHQYTIPDEARCELNALPAFLNQGWVEAFQLPSKSRGPEFIVYEARLDNGAWIQIAKSMYPGELLESLPEHNINHIKERGEIRKGGVGETYIAGDFYIDYRENREWNNQCWKTISTEIRVRRRPDSPEQTTVIVSGQDVNGISVDSDGSMDIDKGYAEDAVEVVVVETVEE